MMEWIENGRWMFFLMIENLTLLVVAAGCFLIYIMRNRKQKSDEEYEYLNMLNRYYRQNADNVKNSYDQMKMLKHDMKNLLLVIANLLSHHQTQEAQELLAEKLQQIEQVYSIVDTDSEYANAILNQKLSEARAAGMGTGCAILTSFAGVGNQDICNLFGNLLDNAIEANTGNHDRPYLELLVEGDRESLDIVCRNSLYRSVEVLDNRLPLTGKNRREHGYGGRIMREIAEKYKGEVRYRVVEQELEATVHLHRMESVHER